MSHRGEATKITLGFFALSSFVLFWYYPQHNFDQC